MSDFRGVYFPRIIDMDQKSDREMNRTVKDETSVNKTLRASAKSKVLYVLFYYWRFVSARVIGITQ